MMSFDCVVAVHRDRWPTADAVQAALERLRYPVSLFSAPNEAFSTVNETLGLPVIFETRVVELEMSVDQCDDADDPDGLWGYLAEQAAPSYTISNGDYFLTLTFRTDADQIRAGLYLAATFILAFDGYGFENQLETHGGAEFAAKLVVEASDASAFED